MKRRYASPAAFKQAVEQRLRSRSTEIDTDLERLRQRLVFERCLARLFQVFGDQVVLKGGLILELRLNRARATKDIDLRLTGKPDGTLVRLQEAGRLDLGDFLAFEIQRDPHHPDIRSDGMVYEGQRFRAEARLAGKIYGRPFGIDVAYADVLTLPPETIAGDDFLRFAGVPPSEWRIYPLETHIAEKLHAYTQPRPRPNSRVKDLPDMALIASIRAFESGLVREAIETTFAHRATHEMPGEVPEPPSHWPVVYEGLARKNNLPWTKIDKLLDAVGTFLNPILSGQDGNWDPRTWTWH